MQNRRSLIIGALVLGTSAVAFDAMKTEVPPTTLAIGGTTHGSNALKVVKDGIVQCRSADDSADASGCDFKVYGTFTDNKPGTLDDAATSILTSESCPSDLSLVPRRGETFGTQISNGGCLIENSGAPWRK